MILNQGKTSVILEAWYLDEINEGAVKPILMQCGVDAHNYFGSSRSPQELIIYPLVRDHPILNEPVPITDYKIADYWPYEDLGDLMYLNGLGDAQFILGRKDRNPEEEGVLTTCMNNRLLLLTLNTHNYMDETLVPLWMNMINFALETHFGG